MLADDISHGHGWAADWCFIIAIACAVIAAAVYVVRMRRREVAVPADGTIHVLHDSAVSAAPVAWSLSLAFIALGLLLL